MDGGGPKLALVPAKCTGAGRKYRRHFGASRGVSFARADLWTAAARSDGRENREPEIFSRDAWKNRGRAGGHFAHGLYGRSGIRSLDAVARRDQSVGCADRERQGVRYSSGGDDRAGHRADRSGADSDRSRLHFQQESPDRIAEVFSGGDWAGEAGGLEERNFCGARGAGAGSEKRREAGAGGAGDQLERSGGALRQIENGAAGAEHGVSRGRAGVSQRPASGQGNVNNVVANSEEDDCAGVRRPREFSGRVKAQHGNDRRSRAPNGFRESSAHALLQSREKDGRAGNLAGLSSFSSLFHRNANSNCP